MAQKLVKARKPLTRTDESGVRHTYQPGAFFYVNNMEMRALLATGQIEAPCDMLPVIGGAPEDCGVVVLNGDLTGAKALLERARLTGVPVVAGNYQTHEFKRTLYLDTAAPLRAELIPVGFIRLSNGWQMAAPLWRYEVQAQHVGTPEERAATAAVIHDLRVPLYDARVVFALDCPEARTALDAMTRAGEWRLTFLRAVYQARPILCALPTTWVR